MDVSIILPAYNEADNICETVLSVKRVLCSLDYEIIVVDDGSRDFTRENMMKHPDERRVRVVGYNENVGKGYALKYGAARAKGNYVLFMDSDLDIEPSSLLQYLNIVKSSDLVIASKRHPKSKVDEPFIRRLLSFSFNVLVRILTNVTLADTQAGLKGFNAGSLRQILPLLSVKKFAFDVEVLVVAKLKGMRVVELPVTVKLRTGFSARNVLRMVIDVLGIAYRLRIIRWYQRNIDNEKAEYTPVIAW